MPNPNPDRRLEDILSRWAEASANIQEHNSALLQRVSDLYLTSRTAPPRPTEVKLPKFDGTRSLPVFLAQFQSAAQSNEWDDEEKGRRLLSALEGSAADLVQTLPPSEYLNYASLCARLQQHYDPAQRIPVAEVELDRRVQRPNESLQAFGADVLSMARAAYPSWPEEAVQTMARKTFIAGIADAETRRNVRLKQPANFNEALVAALHIDAVGLLEPASKRVKVCQAVAETPSTSIATSAQDANEAAADVRRVGGAPGPSQTNPTRTMEQLLEELRAVAASLRPAAQSDSRRPGQECFECGKVGHYARECPSKPRGGRDRHRRNTEYRRGRDRDSERRRSRDRDDHRRRNNGNNDAGGSSKKETGTRGAGNA